MQILPPGLSDPVMLTNLYFILLKYLKNYLEKEDPLAFPHSIFHSGQLDYYDFSRIGGIIGHLTKTMPIEPSNQSGSTSDSLSPMVISQEAIPLPVELFDDVVMLYHLVISSKFKQAAIHMQNQMQGIAQLEENNKRIKRLVFTTVSPN